jgi:hypothetical protein
MLIQDALTGRLHEIPDQPYRSYLGEYGQPYEQRYPQGYGYSPHYGVGQVVYDGLGNPVGLFPLLAKLAPLAAKVLPAVATKVLPAITKVLPSLTRALPMVGKFFPGAAPSPAAMMQPPAAMPPMPFQTPAPPVMAMPGIAPMAVPYSMMTMMAPRIRRSRWRRARRLIRRRIAVPPPPGIMGPVGEARSDGPPNTVQGWEYYGGFNGYGRW